jgi:ubiquinol-cytochrome c reductase cytochrome b subunit
VLVGIVFVAGILVFLKGGLRGFWRWVPLVAAVVLAFLLKAFDAKLWGVVLMGVAVMILFALPWLDRSPVKSIRYRPGWHKIVYAVFVIMFVALGYLGIKPPSLWGTLISQAGTLFYFAFFMLMPWWSRIGEFKPVPDRVTYKPV